MLELLPKKAIKKDDLPPFLNSWIDISSPDCMFNASQLKTWTSAHLRGAGWYLDCGPKYVPDVERALFDAAENADDVVLLDIDAGNMDEATRAKAIAKIHSQDIKKKENLKALFEKELAKEEARKAKEALKTKAKAERTKGKKRKADGVPMTTDLVVFDEVSLSRATTANAGSQRQSSSGRNTKRDSPYEQLSQIPVMVNLEDDASNMDEFIFNTSLAEVLGGDSGPLPPMYYDLKAFMTSVSLLSFYSFILYNLNFITYQHDPKPHVHYLIIFSFLIFCSTMMVRTVVTKVL